MPLHLDKTMSPSLDARGRCKVSPWFKNLQGRTHFSDHELKGVLNLYSLSPLIRPVILSFLMSSDTQIVWLHGEECMLLLYSKFCKRTSLTQKEFFYLVRVIFDIHDESILLRVFCALEDPLVPGIRFDQWICLLSLFCRGTLEEKIAFIWSVYDAMGGGHLTRDHILDMTRPHLGFQHGSCTDEDVNDYADDLLRLLDKDGDGRISFQDYRNSVIETPELLNCLGRVVPEQHVVHAFLSTFSPKVGEKYNVGCKKSKLIDLSMFRRSSS